jgi:catechol 2,3-dioxygenase-like lactoylglutathione lyase family enzyme
MARYTGVNHLALATADLEATIRFWRDLLGMKLVIGQGRPGSRQYFFSITEQDLIAFFEWKEVEPIPEKDHGAPVKGPFVFDHVSIGVAAAEDLWELKDKLEAAGFWASEIVDHGFIWSLYTFDPNGIALEFSVFLDGRHPLRKPRLVDSRPTPAALEGPEPQPGKWPAPRSSTPAEQRVAYPGEAEDYLGKRNWWE